MCRKYSYIIQKVIFILNLLVFQEFPVTNPTLADTFKAIVAALIKSSNEQRAGKFVREILVTQLYGQDINELWNQFENKTPSEKLKEVLSERGIEFPEARLCASSALETILAAYRVGLYDKNKKMMGIGWGESIEEATEIAARDALMRIYDTREERQLLKYSD